MSTTGDALRAMAYEHEHLTSDQAALLVRAADQLDKLELAREAIKDIASRATAHLVRSFP